MLYYITLTLYVFVCLILLLVSLLQQGKGGDMASAFGGGSSQTAFGARGGATLLSKLTTVFAVLFMLGAFVLALLGQRGPGSVVSGTPGPAPVSAPRPAIPVGTPASTPPAQPASAPAAPPAK
jgi:preprotein translocase subunit SecG